MSVRDETIGDLKEVLAELEGSDLQNSCYCIVVTGNSACHSDSIFGFASDSEDPEAIRRFIGALEQIKAHAIQDLMAGHSHE